MAVTFRPSEGTKLKTDTILWWMSLHWLKEHFQNHYLWTQFVTASKSLKFRHRKPNRNPRGIMGRMGWEITAMEQVHKTADFNNRPQLHPLLFNIVLMCIFAENWSRSQKAGRLHYIFSAIRVPQLQDFSFLQTEMYIFSIIIS